MQIEKFMAALLPTFSRDRLLDDIRITRGELMELQPSYAQAVTTLGHWSFKSEAVKAKFAQFKRIVGTGSDNPIVYMSKHFVNILENLQVAEDQAMNLFGGQIAGRGLSLRQATIIQYCDAIFLVSKYMRKLLNYVYVMETAEVSEEPTIGSPIPKAELAWIDEQFVDFCNAFVAAAGVPKEVLASIEGIPDIDLSVGNMHSLAATVGPKKLDPLQLGFLATRFNPIYFVRMIVAEWQVRRYKEMKEELTLLQLRRMNLEKLKAGKADAALDKQMGVVESRVQNLTFELAEMEKGL